MTPSQQQQHEDPDVSPPSSSSETQESENLPPASISWAARVSRASEVSSLSKPLLGPPAGAPKGPPKGPSAEDAGRGKPPPQQPSVDAEAKKTAIPSLPAFALASKERPVVVLDAGALMRVDALDRYRGKCTFVTTTAAAQEVRDAMARQRIESRFLEVHSLEPSAADRSWAERFADMTGDLPFLSQTDLGLVALTYMLQRATGQTQRLNAKPPAFEFFSETELMQKLEDGGAGKHMWTLQYNSAASKIAKDAKGEELKPTDQPEEEQESESAQTDDDDDDMDAEEGWVTEEVLREHLGLAAPDESSCDHANAIENESNNPKEANTQELDNTLANAFSGLELRADKQEIEDLVSCMTTDFSMQNVLLQMGLNVLAVDGRRIRTVKIWALLCRACGHIERKTRLLFCSKCGHYTLDRTPLYFDQTTGKILIFDGRKKISKRGQVYSIPKDKGGKHSWEEILSISLRQRETDRPIDVPMRKQAQYKWRKAAPKNVNINPVRPIILAADQLLMGGLDREMRHKEKLWKKDVESKNPFSPNYCLEAQSWHVRSFTASGRAAAAAPPKVAVGLGPGNPNSNRWMKNRNRNRK